MGACGSKNDKKQKSSKLHGQTKNNGDNMSIESINLESAILTQDFERLYAIESCNGDNVSLIAVNDKSNRKVKKTCKHKKVPILQQSMTPLPQNLDYKESRKKEDSSVVNRNSVSTKTRLNSRAVSAKFSQADDKLISPRQLKILQKNLNRTPINKNNKAIEKIVQRKLKTTNDDNEVKPHLSQSMLDDIVEFCEPKLSSRKLNVSKVHKNKKNVILSGTNKLKKLAMGDQPKGIMPYEYECLCFFKESEIKGPALFDSNDRRFAVACKRFNCLLEVFEKRPVNGFISYPAKLYGYDSKSLIACANMIDSKVGIHLSSQVKAMLSKLPK